MDNSERWKIRDEDRVIILVEGTHDKDFIGKILEVHGFRHPYINVMPKGGKTELERNLKVLVRDPRFQQIERLIVLRDADSLLPSEGGAALAGSDQTTLPAAQRSFDSVRGHLQNARLAAPDSHGELVDGSPRVGCFIFPDGKSDGMLESLCRDSLIDHTDSVCINSLFECVKAHRGAVSFSPKAWTHAFISIQDDPDLHLGKAAKKGYLPLSPPAFSKLVDFLQRACNLNDEQA